LGDVAARSKLRRVHLEGRLVVLSGGGVARLPVDCRVLTSVARRLGICEWFSDMMVVYGVRVRSVVDCSDVE
jgi:hypothetical protein